MDPEDLRTAVCDRFRRGEAPRVADLARDLSATAMTWFDETNRRR